MPFENFDNRLREAAEQHHPNYDEKAWSKMEGLLNKHLPQKDDRRRRIIFFLLLPLILCGGAWLAINKPWRYDRLVNKETDIQQKVSETLSPVGEDKAVKQVIPEKTHSDRHRDEVQRNNNPDAVIRDKTTAGSVVAVNQNQQVNHVPRKKKGHPAESNLEIETSQGNTGKKIQPPGNDQQDGGAAIKTTGNLRNDTDVSHPVSSEKNATGERNDKQDQADLSVNSVSSENKTNQPQRENDAEAPKEKAGKDVAKKGAGKKANAFFFSLSAGPDISSVDPGNPGEVKLMTGAGVGYTIKERLTIRTGFYAVSKVYPASPEDYKPSSPPPASNYLTDISADCKVYEIPLSLSYNFGKSVKHKTFASVGLSSLIMKKETYDYVYYYPGNPTPYYHTYTINNGGEHYFSVLTLSGGYQRRISKTFSLVAEPYIKLPLTGIGFGNVKLNSAGILVSLTINPFETTK